MIGLSGCKTATISQSFDPSIKLTLLEFPRLPEKYKQLNEGGESIYPNLIDFERRFQSATGICMVERDVLYSDLKRIKKTETKLNRKWWELWK
jgi:hypothetical protein